MAEHSETHVESAELRRSPKFGAFFAIGGAFGVLLALILTYGVGAEQISATTGARYSDAQVFGFLLLACIPVGLALGGAVALVFDRVFSRRVRNVRIERESVETDE